MATIELELDENMLERARRLAESREYTLEEFITILFDRYSISVITVMEIVKGLHKLQREDRIEEFLEDADALELFTLDIRSSEVAGRIYADLEPTGQPMGRADPMIAAIAMRYDLTLVGVGHMKGYTCGKQFFVIPILSARK